MDKSHGSITIFFHSAITFLPPLPWHYPVPGGEAQMTRRAALLWKSSAISSRDEHVIDNHVSMQNETKTIPPHAG